PPNIGVLDYHGPLRLYGRESIQAITLSFDQNTQDQRKQAALYNYSSKYGAVKAEMAASFIKDMLARHAAPHLLTTQPLARTLETLFEHFFPEKRFLGPRATAEGSLTFPVELGGA